MEAFFDFEIESMGGNQTFLFAPTKTILSMPDVIDNSIISEISFLSGCGFLEGKYIPGTLDFSEKSVPSQGGDYFSTVVSGMVPKLTKEYLNLFTQMLKQRFMLNVVDNNGSKRIVGSIRAGAKFSFEQASSTTPAGASGFKFQFTLDSPVPSPFYMV